MSILRKIKKQRAVRKSRCRAKLTASGRMRISVFRSLNNISAQIIDDAAQKTVASFSSLQLDAKNGDKKVVARLVGETLAKLAHERGVKHVVFDRSGYLYHGRIKELAEGLRAGGLEL